MLQFKNLTIPRDDINHLGREVLDLCELELFGKLPVLTIALHQEQTLRTGSDDYYPNLTLNEGDLVVERVQEYAQEWPLSDHSMTNLIQLIAFKIRQFTNDFEKYD